MKSILSVLLLISLSIFAGACTDSTISGVINADGDGDQSGAPEGDVEIETDAAETEAETDGDFVDDDLEPENETETDIEDPTYTVSPRELDFGCVIAGNEEVVRTVRIENFGPKRAIIVSYHLTSDSVPQFYILPEDYLAENESITLLPGGRLDVDVGYLGTGIAGTGGALEISISHSPEPIMIELRHENSGNPIIEISPDNEIDFGMISKNRFTQVPVKISNGLDLADGCATLELSNFRFSNPELSVFQTQDLGIGSFGERLIPMNGSFTFNISCYSVEAGTYENTLIFDTNDPERPEARINLSCQTANQNLILSPNFVAFPLTEVNDSSTVEISICNHGFIPLTLGGTEISEMKDENVFEVIDENTYPLILDALPENDEEAQDDCISVLVRFSPTKKNSPIAQLVVLDGESNALATGLLFGTGSAPEIGIEINDQEVGESEYFLGIYHVNQPGETPLEPARITLRNKSTINDIKLCALESVDESNSWTLSDYEPGNPNENCITMGRLGSAGDNEFRMLATYDNSDDFGTHYLKLYYTFRMPDDSFSYHKIATLLAATESCMTNYHQVFSEECNYYCIESDSNDYPDTEGIDNDCDGIDGYIAESYFVARDGLPTNPGTWSQPLDSIQAAIQKAALSSTKKNVLVATGDYYEQIELISGVNLYGGYEEHAIDDESPIGWKHSSGLKTRIFGFHTGLKANNINQPTEISRFEIRAIPNEVMDVSTYGMHIVNSGGLTVSDCIINADFGLDGRPGNSAGANGADGGDGLPGSAACESDSSDLCGHCEIPLPGTGGSSSCGADGGSGGAPCHAGALEFCAGQAGQDAANAAAPFGLGGAGSNGAAGLSGENGYTAIKAQNGQGGDNEGSLIGNFWYPSQAGKGWNGINGGGGGGGGGGGVQNLPVACAVYSGAGGGGGAGGCGGSGGDGGWGGGSSFGVFVKGCNPQIKNTEITAGDGGNGGAGRSGGKGGAGGSGAPGGAGSGIPMVGFAGGSGGDGKAGGDGGDGGSGGGGAGGSSFGVFRVDGANPYLVNCKISVGKAGQGGTGGDLDGNAGENGISAEEYIFEEE